MASSSHCFFVVSMVLVSQFLVGSALASTLNSTTYIDKLCDMSFINDKPFCLQTLSAYPPAASATALIPLAKTVILDIVLPQAKKAATFADDAAKTDPTFNKCHDVYVTIQYYLESAAYALVEDPQSAHTDAMACTKQTTEVSDLVGKKEDIASKTLMQMTMETNKLLPLAVAATQVVGG